MSSKKCIKVNFQGETKRIKMTNSYESLALQTRDTFDPDLAKIWPIKFYYLDEEHELISITSQSDF
jgi:PB1 domain